VIDRYPISAGSRAALRRLVADDKDYLPGLTRSEKIEYLRRTPYTTFLQEDAGVPGEVTALLRDGIRGLWGVGWDSLSALEGYRAGMPATAGLGIGRLEDEPAKIDEPYIFHFPDGNAGVARSLVRRLVPEALAGESMEDLVLARLDYGTLDVRGATNRIRLDSTAVDVRHTPDQRHVDVTYVRHGSVERVRGKHAILACYNQIVPHLCPELPDDQRAAIESVTKVPLVYVNVAIRNWRAFRALGFHNIRIPQPALMHSFGMDFPVSMGGYHYTDSADEPTVIHGSFVPAFPDQGLAPMEQHKRGRRQIYEMSFDDFETAILRQMSGALEPGGFDAGRDIAAITVNRWPHGYAYEYNELFDPPGFNRYNGPHLLGARQLGRISIANSDAAGYAYVNGAIDAAHRAVGEQLATA
jgi:spermidine dehydrogenase